MLTGILNREDVSSLLKEVVNNNRYHKKDELESVDYLKFIDSEQALFVVVDALYKYKIIIDDDNLIKDYIEQLNLLMKKVNNFVDIDDGVNRLIAKFCGLKLGFKDLDTNKDKIIKYVYDKYVTNGYLFHAVNDVYKKDIKQSGFTPQKYRNLYNEFINVKSILNEDLIEEDFSSNKVSFTNSFAMAYYYAVSSPIYFYKLICDNNIIKKDADKRTYLNNDYEGSLKNINKIINRLELKEKDADKVREVFNKEWELINHSNSCPTIMIIKRGLVLKDEDLNIDNIINNSDLSIGEALGKILNHRVDDIECNFYIDAKDIEFIELPSYNSLVFKNEKVVVEEEKTIKDDSYNNDYGKASIMIIIGSILITLGVIITMVMIITGG